VQHKPTHAVKQAVTRLGYTPSFERILEKIKAGEAKFVSLGTQGRFIYDVPMRSQFNADIIIRVVVEADKNWVVTILPAEFQVEKCRRLEKERERVEKQRKRKYFRDLQEDETDVVTATRG
jgi:hypothetical protein